MPDGQYDAAFAIETTPSRALPGFTVCRVPLFGPSVPEHRWETAIDVIRQHAVTNARVLHVAVELFFLDPDQLARAVGACESQGFALVPEPRNYVHTPILDLRPGLDVVWRNISARIRRAVRTTEREGCEVRTVYESTRARDLEALISESFARTGGTPPVLDWRGAIQTARAAPEASRVVGLWATGHEAAKAPLAFAWGWNDGRVGTYFAGGSTRHSPLKVPLMAALLWDLISWSHSHGAQWFDLGGSGDSDDGDTPIAGITHFKRGFTSDVTRVGAELSFSGRPKLASIAAIISRSARRWRASS
jgi:hypothetical protein